LSQCNNNGDRKKVVDTYPLYFGGQPITPIPKKKPVIESPVPSVLNHFNAEDIDDENVTMSDADVMEDELE